jgi:hypothetical protein
MTDAVRDDFRSLFEHSPDRGLIESRDELEKDLSAWESPSQ